MTAALARIVIDISIFLEFADDATVDPDAAVAQLELLGGRLQELPADDRTALAAAVRELATAEPEHADFVRSLPETLGFA
jgi:hypothetical protein